MIHAFAAWIIATGSPPVPSAKRHTPINMRTDISAAQDLMPAEGDEYHAG
jgi:hypothetical protein